MIRVLEYVAAVVTINPTPSGAVCEGTVVRYDAIPGNGGNNPSYQWQVNGEAKGTDNHIFAYYPVNGDVIMCILTSDEICSTGNPAVSNGYHGSEQHSIRNGTSKPLNC